MWTCPKCSKKVDDAYEICWACGTTVDGVEDPHFLDESNPDMEARSAAEDGRPEGLVTVTKCWTSEEAHAVRLRLESESVPVFLFNEFFTLSMLDWAIANPTGGIKVQVPTAYVERAREIVRLIEEEIAAAENEEPDAGEENDDTYDETYDEESYANTQDAPEDGADDNNEMMQEADGDGIINKGNEQS